MKIKRKIGQDIIIGKRIPAGAAIQGLGTLFASLFPQHAVAIMAATIPLTALVQVFVVNKYGVTPTD